MLKGEARGRWTLLRRLPTHEKKYLLEVSWGIKAINTTMAVTDDKQWEQLNNVASWLGS